MENQKNQYKYDFQPSKLDKISFRITSNDNRTMVSNENCSSLPYSAIGLLKIIYNHNAVSYRTGVLIAKNIVLTAGHNLYDSRKNPNNASEVLGNPVSIEFFPGLNDNSNIFGKADFEKFFYPKNFPKDGKEDYGIIVLKENIGEKTGYLDLTIFDEENINNIFYNCGYPINKTTNNNTNFFLYESSGKLENANFERGIIVSGIKSSYGQSGAGLFYKKDSKFNVVGVHVASSFDDSLFYATMITSKRYNQIQKWIEESK